MLVQPVGKTQLKTMMQNVFSLDFKFPRGRKHICKRSLLCHSLPNPPLWHRSGLALSIALLFGAHCLLSSDPTHTKLPRDSASWGRPVPVRNCFCMGESNSGGSRLARPKTNRHRPPQVYLCWNWVYVFSFILTAPWFNIQYRVWGEKDVALSFLKHAGKNRASLALDTLSTVQKPNIEWTRGKVQGYVLSEHVCAAATKYRRLVNIEQPIETSIARYWQVGCLVKAWSLLPKQCLHCCCLCACGG